MKTQEKRPGSGLQAPSSKEATTEGRISPSIPTQAPSSKQPSATKGTSEEERNAARSISVDPIDPGEVPQQPVLDLPPVITEDIPPPVPMGELSKVISQEEDPSNLDSDQGGFTDDGASKSSSSHATPPKPTRERK